MDKKSLIYLASMLPLLMSCDSETDLPVQRPDGADQILFSANTEKVISRATSGYIKYDSNIHPSTMGVFGYYSLSSHDFGVGADNQDNHTIFSNTCCTPTLDGQQTWTYNDPRYWAEFSSFSSFDFVGYMPHLDSKEVSFTRAAEEKNKYTLSFPVSLTAEDGSTAPCPIIHDTRQAPIISNAPARKTDTGEKIHLLFDQTLTGYNLKFHLDERTGKIRHFRIRNVSLSGSSLAYSGTVSRTYTLEDNIWSASPITWTELKRTSILDNAPLAIAYTDNGGGTDDCYVTDATDNTKSSLIVKADKPRQWGSSFYTIPDEKFMPKITVTYDVELTDEDGKNVTLRKGVRSSIVFNKVNFKDLTAGQTGHINSIDVLIQPLFLYVIADEDKYTGHLLIE